jgi:hypothetical protein
MTDRRQFSEDWSADCVIVRGVIAKMDPGRVFTAALIGRQAEVDRERARGICRYLWRQREIESLANGRFRVPVKPLTFGDS